MNMRKISRIVFIVLFAPVVLYYLWTRAGVYFKFSKEAYTDYFWYRAPWVFAHVILGVTATLIGPFQFIPALRYNHPRLHRSMGKIYLGAVAASTFVSFYLVSTTGLGPVYAAGLGMLGITWLSSTLMAWLSIRNGTKVMHKEWMIKEWMIKSYVLTLSFVTFRFIEDLLVMAGVSDFAGRKILMAWACWSIPLFITELVFNTKKLYN
jgi:uncharacterized membrane protein